MQISPMAYRINIFWCFFAPIFIVFFIKIGVDNRFIFSIKDVPFILLFVYFGVKGFFFERRLIYLYPLLIIFITYLFLNWVFLNPNYGFVIANIRQLLMPILLIMFFSSCTLEGEDAVSVYTYVAWLSVSVFLIGVICLYFNVWESVGLDKFFSLKGIPVNAEGLSYMFYEPILGYSRRMVSTMLDPISLGHTIAAVFISVWFVWPAKNYRFHILFVLFLMVLSTMSKGAILQVVIACVFLAKKNHPIFKIVTLILVTSFIIWLPNKEGILIHVEGTVNSFSKAELFGYGIGNVGNYAKMFNDNLEIYNSVEISDTYIGAVLGQLGLFGFIMWVSILCYLVFLNRNSCRVSKILLFSILLVSVLSENTLNFSSFYMTAILIGLNDSIANRGRDEKRNFHIGN